MTETVKIVQSAQVGGSLMTEEPKMVLVPEGSDGLVEKDYIAHLERGLTALQQEVERKQRVTAENLQMIRDLISERDTALSSIRELEAGLREVLSHLPNRCACVECERPADDRDEVCNRNTLRRKMERLLGEQG